MIEMRADPLSPPDSAEYRAATHPHNATVVRVGGHGRSPAPRRGTPTPFALVAPLPTKKIG
jgi:hypothetical protein